MRENKVGFAWIFPQGFLLLLTLDASSSIPLTASVWSLENVLSHSSSLKNGRALKHGFTAEATCSMSIWFTYLKFKFTHLNQIIPSQVDNSIFFNYVSFNIQLYTLNSLSLTHKHKQCSSLSLSLTHAHTQPRPTLCSGFS